jgi:hypothetical protein
MARRLVDRTARVQQKKCPKSQKEQIKIEVNVVYQKRSVCVSTRREKHRKIKEILLENSTAGN